MHVDPKTPQIRQDSKSEEERKTRRCLMCGDRFQSEWAGERVCRKCKSTAAWRSG